MISCSASTSSPAAGWTRSSRPWSRVATRRIDVVRGPTGGRGGEHSHGGPGYRAAAWWPRGCEQPASAMTAALAATKPATLAPRFEAFPAQLSSLHQWVLWRWESREERWTKPLFSVDGRLAPSTDPRTWAPLEHVQIVHELEPERFDGVGFVLSPEVDFVGIDLDHVIEDDGTIHPEALRIVQEINSYTERSPSGHGLRIIARGALPLGWRNARSALAFPIECYREGRYITITGHRLEGAPEIIE